MRHRTHRRDETALAPAPGTGARLVPQLTAAYVVAATEHALDLRARQETIDLTAVSTEMRRRLADAGGGPTAPTPIAAAELAFASATLTRLVDADADAFARAAAMAERVGDRWLVACAWAQEADAAAMSGKAARAVDRLRGAHQIAVQLGAQPLSEDIEAIARRTESASMPQQFTPWSSKTPSDWA